MYTLIVIYAGISGGITMNAVVTFDGFKTLTECEVSGLEIELTRGPDLTKLEWSCDETPVATIKS